MEETKKKEKYKISNLSKQVVIPTFIILLAACVFNVVFLTITNTLDYIIESERDAYKLGNLTVNMLEEYESLPFLVPYWIEHGDEMDHVFDDAELRKKDIELHHRWPGLVNIKETDPDVLAKQDESIKKLYAEVAYGNLCRQFNRLKDSAKPKYLYSFVIIDGEFRYLVTGLKDDETHSSAGGDIYELGDSRPYNEGDYPSLDRLLATMRYEFRLDATISRHEATAVHLFLPVIQNGNLIMIVGVTNDFGNLFIGGLEQSGIQIIVNIILFGILAVLTISRIRNKVLIPVKRTNEAVDAYKEEKDSDKVVKSLGQINSENEIQDLARSFGGMAVELDEYIEEVKNVTAKNERIIAELNLATKIQADMLPNEFPDRKEFMLCASMDPAKEVGGDFYDFFFIDENHLALVIADVSGKGIPASLFMMISMTLLETRSMMGGDLSEIFEDVNMKLCERNENDFFVTVWMAIIDLRTGDGIAANAGHEHPGICRKDGQYELEIYHHSMALGVMEGVPFRQHEFHLNPGDKIFVYTDGVAEATDMNNELFGTDRMLENLNTAGAKTPKDVIEGMRTAIDDFVGEAEQFDDITMLSFFYEGD